MRAATGGGPTVTRTVTPAGLRRGLPARSRWTPALLAVLLVPLALDAAPLGHRATALALDAVSALLCVAGGLLALSAARRQGPGRTGRGPWRWVALALGVRLVGELAWLWTEAVRGLPPFPSVADLAFVAFYPTLAVALLRFPTSRQRGAHRAVLMLDVLTVAAGACVLLWHLLVSDLVESGIATRSSALTLAYAVGDVVLVLAAARAAALGTLRRGREPLAVLVGALVCLVLADVMFGRQVTASGPDRLGVAVDLAWTAGLVLLAVAADLARSARPSSEPEPAPHGTASELPPAPSLLPYGAALLTLALVGDAAADLPLHPHGGLLAAAIVVVLAVVVRQVVVGREHSRLVRLYESAAIEDTLTGALTRRRLLELGNRLTGRGRAAVFVIDVDHFKSVNDTHGHLAGDVVLTVVTQRCQAALRPGDLLGRYGGDEFVAVLPGADAETAMRVAERMHRAATSEPADAAGTAIPISLSVGVTSSALPGPLEPLIDRADAALYAAKATGRGRVINGDERGASATEESAGAAATPPPTEPATAPLGPRDLQRAVGAGQLVVHYQPRLDLRTGRLTCAEAFARWEHPDRGLLDAGAFLPDLTDRASLLLLTDRVLGVALADCAAWRAVDPDLRVAVNLPRELLGDPWLPTRLAATAAEAGLPTDALELEITEEALGDDDVAGTVVAGLREVGLRVSVDDFGTGATSLTTLRCHSVDVLKLHPSLLSGRLADPRDLAVIRALTSLGHELGTTVVAEGVEDAPSRDLLAALGVDEAQGHLVSRPVPTGDLLPFVAASRAGLAEAARASSRPPAPFGQAAAADLESLLLPARAE